MINTTIYSICDKVICVNIDSVSILIGFGLGVIWSLVSYIKKEKTTK